MKVIKEFGEFIKRGNVIDMAVGIIIGGAFGKIVSSLVNDVLMPPIGMILGGKNFADLAIELKAKAGDQAAIVLAYGKFINTVIDFIIISLVIFIMIRMINKLRHPKPAEEAPAPERKEVTLLTEIRDLLKK